MTDPIREAFEKHLKNLLSFATLNGVYVDTGTHWRWVDWQEAWQQSRREALLEAAGMVVDLSARKGRNGATAKHIAEALRAAAEEVGK